MIKITWFRPLTCECEIGYKWDTNDPPSSRTHTYYATRHKCAAHSGLNDNALYNAILDQNGRLPKFSAGLANLFPSQLGQEENVGVGKVIRLKDGIDIEWGFTGTDENRVLRVHLIGYTLTSQQLSAAQNWCDNRFGAGKVVVY